MELRDAFGPVMPDTTGYWVLRSQAGYPDKAVPSLCTCKGIRRISEPNKFRLFRKLWQLHKLREIEAHLFYSLFYFWTLFFKIFPLDGIQSDIATGFIENNSVLLDKMCVPVIKIRIKKFLSH